MPDPTVTRYFNGQTKKCMGTSVMTPRNTELHWRVYKNEPKISSKDFPKVNDPTISEFMATFSAWIRVPDHRVLRCGSKVKKITEFLYIWCWGQGFGGVQSIGPRMGLFSPQPFSPHLNSSFQNYHMVLPQASPHHLWRHHGKLPKSYQFTWSFIAL